MNALSRRAVLLLLGLVAGTIVSAEVLFTRLLSVSTLSLIHISEPTRPY